MAITDMVTQTNKLIIAAIFATISVTSISGEWRFEPKLTADETYSDNVNLLQTNKTSSLVSQLGVDLEATYTAQHASFNLSSTSKYAFFSHDHTLDNDFNTYNSDFSISLWPNGIEFVGSASLTNQSRDTNRNALADIVSGDTIQVKTYQSGFIYNVNNSDFELSSSVAYQINKSEDNIGERKGYATSLVTKNGSSARVILWDVNSTYQSLKNNTQNAQRYVNEIKLGLITDYKINPFLRFYDEDSTGNINRNQALESTSYGAGIRWLVTPRLFLDVAYNHPISAQLDSNNNKQNNYISSTVGWQPSLRTTLDATISQRFYGNSYGANFTHNNRRLTNQISYNESVQAFTRNNFRQNILGNFFCPVNDTTIIENCYLSDDTNFDVSNTQLVTLSEFVLIEDDQYSLNKTLQWTSSLDLPRTTFSMNLNSNNRENLSNNIKDEIKNATFTINRIVSGYSNINTSFSYQENNINLNQANEQLNIYRQYRLDYERQLNSRLSATLGISHLNRNSTENEFNYKENRVYLRINKGF